MTARTLTFAATFFSAAVLSAQPPSPNRTSRDWKRLVAGDLEAVGNTPERELRRALDELQRFRGTLLALFPGLNARSPERLTLVVLRPETFARFTPRDGRGRRQEN